MTLLSSIVSAGYEDCHEWQVVRGIKSLSSQHLVQLKEGVSFLNNFYLVSGHCWNMEVKYEQKFVHFQDLRVE